MLSINANDLKRNGIAGIERAMVNGLENSVMVDVRGKAIVIRGQSSDKGAERLIEKKGMHFSVVVIAKT